MELEISALPDDGLRCTAELKRAEWRLPASLLDSRVPRSEALVAMCSWCKRVRVRPGSWLEIEEAVSALRLLEDLPPGITHTICRDLKTALYGPEF
jgi:hypothetical protein